MTNIVARHKETGEILKGEFYVRFDGVVGFIEDTSTYKDDRVYDEFVAYLEYEVILE